MSAKKRSRLSVAFGLLRYYWWIFSESDAVRRTLRVIRGVFIFCLFTLAFVVGMLMPIGGVVLALLAVSMVNGEA